MATATDLIYRSIWTHRKLRDRAMRTARIYDQHARDEHAPRAIWIRAARRHNWNLVRGLHMLKMQQLSFPRFTTPPQ